MSAALLIGIFSPVHFSLFRIMQCCFQYSLSFPLAQDALLHVVEHFYKAPVHFFFFRGMRCKGIDENKRDVLQVPPAARTAKEALCQAGIAFGDGADGVSKVFIHEHKGGLMEGKRKVSFCCEA